MENLNLNVDLEFNQAQVKADAEKAKGEITGVANSAEKSAQKVAESVNRISASQQAILDKYAKNAKEAEALYASKQQANAQNVTPANNIKEVANEVLNLAKANDTNNESQKEGTGILEGLSLETFTWTGLIGLATTAIIANKDKIYDWVVSLFTGVEANDKLTQSQKDLNTAINSAEYGNAIKSVYELKAGVAEVEKGHKTAKEVIDLYNDTLGVAAGKETTLKGVKDSIVANSDNYIEAILKEAYAQTVLTNAVAKRKELEERKRNGENFADKSNALTYTLSAIANNPSEIFDVGDIYDQAKKRNKAYGIQGLVKDEKEGFEDVKKVYGELGDFLKKTKLTLTKPDDETKGKKASSADAELNAQRALQAKIDNLNERGKIKTLTDDEQEIANVKKKYADLLKEAIEFNKKKSNIKRGLAVNTGGLAGSEKGEIDAITQKRAQEAKAKQDKIDKDYYDKLLKDFMDYGQKREELTKVYEKDFALLANNPEQQAERTKRYDKDLKELDDHNAKKLDSYKLLFEGIETLGKKQALAVLQKARVQLAKDIKEGAIVDPAEIAKVKKYFNELEDTITNGSGQALIELAGKVNDVASAVGGIDSAFGKVLGTLSNVLGQVGNIKKGFKDFNVAGAKGDTLGQLGAGLGIVGAGISIFSSIFKLFDKSAEREAQQATNRDLQNKQTEAVNKALERQVALLNDAYGTDKIKKYDEAITQARANQAKFTAEVIGKYQLTGNNVIDDIVKKFNDGSLEKSGIDRARFNQFVDKGVIKNVATPDIEELRKLLEAGKLDASTSLIVENLIKAKETADQLANSLRAENVGSTLSEIADDFINTLTDGTQDFGKTFEETIQKSLLNGFKGEVIRKQLQAFYEQFATLSEGGLTKDEIETLRLSYISAADKAKADLEALSKATGIDLTSKNGATASSSTGLIRAELTEETGSKLLGLFRSQYDITKQQLTTANEGLAIFRNSFLAQKAIEANTLRTADNTDKLNEKLDAIISNTKPPVTGRGAGYNIP